MKQPDFDVVIVGAGLSGIGAAVHLQRRCGGKSYRIIEARDSIGGTWDLFRYPGIRSDSDMHTLGYNFKPWTAAEAIADGPNILQYVRETADENQVTEHIQFNTRVVSLNWSSDDSMWRITTTDQDGSESVTTCRMVNVCSGYYRYDQGYLPEFPGYDDFQGTLIHPQHWPENLDYTGKRVIVIGSGATAVTLVPAMSERAAHVTMLQRSPTYIVSRPAKDRFANLLRKVLPSNWAYSITRWRNVGWQQFYYRVARKRPEKFKEFVVNLIRKEMGDEFDVDKHFSPSYAPWDQRICLVPDSDLFNSIKMGKVSVVTDQIESFTTGGIQLKSGETLEADIIVTATGLNLQMIGGADVLIDDVPVVPNDSLNYKGVMLSNVPNLGITFGYTNASWTLKADLTSEYLCRLINHMDQHGYVSVMPRLDEMPAETLPFLDFSSGYVQRGLDMLPRQHQDKPWRLDQNYRSDLMNLRFGRIEDGVLEFRKPQEQHAPAPQMAVEVS